MPRITNWRRESARRRSRIGTPRLVCKPSCIERQIRIGTNGVEQSSSTATRGVVAGYETKDATAFRDELRSVPPGPQLSRCPNEDVRVGEKAADGANVQRWYDCPDCGYEAPSRIVYGAER